MIHEQQSPLAGETVKLKNTVEDIGGQEYHVEDWWDRVNDKSWQLSNGNPAAMIYAMRSGLSRLPIDDEVLYGKIDGSGFLVHISELKE